MFPSLPSPCLFLVTLALFAASPGLLAADPPDAAAGKSAHVRLWKTRCPGQDELLVVLRPSGNGGGKKPKAVDLGRLSAGFRFDTYQEVPAQRGDLLVLRESASADKPLASLPDRWLAAGGYYTVLICPQPGSEGDLRAEWIDDTGSPSERTLAVRNFLPDIHDLHMVFGDALDVRLKAPGSYVRAGGLPAVTATMHLSGTDAAGKLFEWSSEIDLKTTPHQTCLICPDPYGRISPRLVEDAPAATVQPAPALDPDEKTN